MNLFEREIEHLTIITTAFLAAIIGAVLAKSGGMPYLADSMGGTAIVLGLFSCWYGALIARAMRDFW